MKKTPRVADHRARILIVDDERDNRELLELFLAWEGFLVLTAKNGREALTKIAAEPADLVLLDVMMPGMTGYEVAATLKADVGTKGVPIIMVTAIEDPNARALAARAGAQDFVEKPVDRADLLSRIRTLLQTTYPDYRES